MKLYFSKGSCSLSIRIILHELGLPCAFEAVDLNTKKTQNNEDFYQISPKGLVPVLVLDDKQILTECPVIMQYLADLRSGTSLLPDSTKMERYRVLEWLNFISSDLHKNCSHLFYTKTSFESKREIFIPKIVKILDYIDSFLDERRYLVSDSFTLPDAYLFVILSWLKHFNIELKKWANAHRYFSTLKERPSILKALDEEALFF
jgi:glutathione S-transferase